MSSIIIEKAWNVRTTSAQDKLLLIAIADIADRKGHFSTSYDEMASMTSLDYNAIYASLNNLYAHYQILQTRRTEDANAILGALIFSESQAAVPNLMQAAELQAQRLNKGQTTSNAKLARSQRKQVAPLNISDKEKNVHIFEINLENVPDWAEGLMHKHAVLGRNDIWQSFVEDVWATGEKNFTIGHLIKRLSQKIHDFKELSFPKSNKPLKQEILKQDSVSEFEEKFNNYLQGPES